MKVLLFNGSPHKEGCTDRALTEVAKTLEANGIDTEIFHIGSSPVGGCTACGGCAQLGKCVYDDVVNMALERLDKADGYVFGSPVYYASPNGSMLGFMDRLFYSGKKYMEYKPAAAVVSARRAGTTASLDAMTKYFTISNMPVVSGNYWNMVHGSKSEDVSEDREGLQTMRAIGNNMAWLLQCIAAGKEQGILPKKEEKIYTNFIR